MNTGNLSVPQKKIKTHSQSQFHAENVDIECVKSLLYEI